VKKLLQVFPGETLHERLESLTRRNVCLASAAGEERENTCRMATCFLPIEDFAKKFGDPHESDFSEDGLDGAGKVHVTWYVKTPRGVVGIGDYWWNPKDQLSIWASNYWSALWTVKWLKLYGVRACLGNGKGQS